VIAVGIDLIELDRIASVINRHGWRFFERCFTLQEIIDSNGKLEAVAVRFAAKEAASKALGTGIGSVGWRDIEILVLPSGQPQLELHGTAAEAAADLHLDTFSLSLTHTDHYAAAVVVAVSE